MPPVVAVDANRSVLSAQNNLTYNRMQVFYVFVRKRDSAELPTRKHLHHVVVLHFHRGHFDFANCCLALGK